MLRNKVLCSETKEQKRHKKQKEYFFRKTKNVIDKNKKTYVSSVTFVLLFLPRQARKRLGDNFLGKLESDFVDNFLDKLESA